VIRWLDCGEISVKGPLPTFNAIGGKERKLEISTVIVVPGTGGGGGGAIDAPPPPQPVNRASMPKTAVYM